MIPANMIRGDLGTLSDCCSQFYIQSTYTLRQCVCGCDRMFACADSVFSVQSVDVGSLYHLMMCGMQHKEWRADMTIDDAAVARSKNSAQV